MSNGGPRACSAHYPDYRPSPGAGRAAALTSDILPTLRSAPGFIAGYWLDPAVDGKGFSMVLFESEQQARGRCPTGTWEAPGVTIIDVDFRRVAATLP